MTNDMLMVTFLVIFIVGLWTFTVIKIVNILQFVIYVFFKKPKTTKTNIKCCYILQLPCFISASYFSQSVQVFHSIAQNITGIYLLSQPNSFKAH